MAIKKFDAGAIATNGGIIGKVMKCETCGCQIHVCHRGILWCQHCGTLTEAGGCRRIPESRQRVVDAVQKLKECNHTLAELMRRL